VRLHGATKLYVSGYSDAELEWWARRIHTWSKGQQPADAKIITPSGKKLNRDVFVYFDNDAKVHAPFDAQRLAERVRISASPFFQPVSKQRSGKKQRRRSVG